MSNPSDHKVRIGLVGPGQRGLQHLNALWQIEDAAVVALCDPYPENLEERKIQAYVEGFRMGAIRTYDRFADFLRAGGLDAVYFCIPPGRHDGEIPRAAAAGLHIFAEKPISLFLDEALEMERAIRRSGVISTVGFQLRHDTRHTVAKDFLQDKRLVMATHVGNGSMESHGVKHTHTEELGGPGNRIWTANFAWSGSSIVEAGIHSLDLWRYWAGDVVWARANYIHRGAEDIEDGGDNPFGYAATFGFASGMIGNMILTRLRKTLYSDSYEDIAWDRGHLKLEAEGPVAYYYDGPYPPSGPVDAAGLRHPLPVPPRNDITLAINQAFVSAVSTGDEAGLLNTFSSSMNSLAAVLAANVSDRLGGERVALQDLLEDARYAEFRKKPVAIE